MWLGSWVYQKYETIPHITSIGYGVRDLATTKTRLMMEGAASCRFSSGHVASRILG